MTKNAILLAGCDAGASEIATEAARPMFPDAPVARVKDADEALARTPVAETELLVLAASHPTEVAKAMEATDAAGLPRWAVVVLSSHPASGDGETLSPGEWDARAVRRAFRSALAQHALRREVARARGDLLAIGSRVAHDLRTQVAGILATSELLREILADDDAAHAELTEPIFESVDGLGKIIERLSFLAKASATRAANQHVEMSDIVFRALQRMDGEILQQHALIVGPESWPEVTAEPAWMEKIWVNLLANALAHGGERLQIELGWTQENGEHKFWIRDNGVGVCLEKRSQLFQPFHLLHQPNSPRGLGLPIIQRLVEMQGGRCGYAPREEGGSIFFFTLPLMLERSRGFTPSIAK